MSGTGVKHGPEAQDSYKGGLVAEAFAPIQFMCTTDIKKQWVTVFRGATPSTTLGCL